MKRQPTEKRVSKNLRKLYRQQVNQKATDDVVNLLENHAKALKAAKVKEKKMLVAIVCLSVGLPLVGMAIGWCLKVLA